MALTNENLLFLGAWRTIDHAYLEISLSASSNSSKNIVPKIYQCLLWRHSGTQGVVIGVGLSIGYPMKLDVSPAVLVVISTSLGGPTNRASISSGDLIMAIDEASTETMGIYDAADIM